MATRYSLEQPACRRCRTSPTGHAPHAPHRGRHRAHCETPRTPTGPALAFPHAQWRAFLNGIRAGELA
ncbi:MAG: DUF397 domain-containing protein [Pseudonocardiales bacterium]|nr:DUF397 domain-containing protein [Pseudonocardiales bacterium]